MRKLSVMVAVAPKPLRQVIERLLVADPRFHIVERLVPGRDLVARSRRVAPDLVVANLRFLGREHPRVMEDLRRFSPAAKVLLIHSYARPRGLGAHAHLGEQAVVRRLLAVLRELARGAGGPDRNPRSREPDNVETHSR